MLHDLRYAVRMFARRPGLTAIVILTLGLGIGANTAMFSIVNAVLLRPLPYADPERLVAVWASIVGQAQESKIFISYRDLQEFRDRSQSFERIEGVTWAAAGRTMRWQGVAQRVTAIPATVGFFSLLGAQAAQGRTFERSDLDAGCAAVLSHGFWVDRLGRAGAIVGSRVTLDDQPCTIVGVMPPAFEFYPRVAEMWTLIGRDSAFERQPLSSSIGVFGRLKPDVTRASAQAELSLLHEQVARSAPPDSWLGQIRPVLHELQEEFTWLAGRNLRTGLAVLFGAVICVLLIACVNVANLQLARATERERELAVRAALGSGRARLVRQLIAESMVLALLGALLGTMVAVAGVSWFRSASPVELPPGNAVSVDWQVLAFTAGLTILAGLLSGLMPAVKASRIDLNDALKDTARGNTSGALAHHATRLFIVAEVALSLTLLAVAGLLIQSIARLGAVPLGFRTDHLLTAQLNLPAASYPDLPRRAVFYDALSSRLAALPGVDAVGISSRGATNVSLTVTGRDAPRTALGDVTVEDVSGDYLTAMGIPLLRGQAFARGDQADAQPVAIVNDALARKYFPNEEAVGRSIKVGSPDEGKSPWLLIVGVAGSVKGITLFNEMAYDTAPLVYRPLTQSAGGAVTIALRTDRDVAGLTPALQAEVAALDGGVPVHGVRSMEQRIAESLAHPRFRARLLGGFAGLALLLAAIGIYGVLSESVSHRTREMGIRMALGAERRDVLRLVIRQGLVLTTAGAVVGVAAALWATRFVTSMLYGVTPADPLTFAAVLLVLGSVVVVASYVPARRTTNVDPMTALRDE